ncbi:MAG: RnfABCDGE type electron transport complex subunit G [Elusimicrobiota bacterium]|nr:RnfABCDGE type electron transport complex subunit G [Endomicrobiia bacterium]MDW8164959.1 RnfABCDGE type electron transport complex subunit G [Elusimicrobiota bacterium]
MNIFKMVLVLFIVCCFSALSLSFLYVKTQPQIQLNKINKEIKLKKLIIPQAESFIGKNLENGFDIEECYDVNKNLVGILIKNTTKGYGGTIEYLVGVKLEIPPKIVGIKILSHKETPGLGANITKDKFLSQFIDKAPYEIVLKKDNPDGKIDAITGATITSRALTDSLNKLLSDINLENYIKFRLSNIQKEEQRQKLKSQKPTLSTEIKRTVNVEQSTSTITQDIQTSQ